MPKKLPLNVLIVQQQGSGAIIAAIPYNRQTWSRAYAKKLILQCIPVEDAADYGGYERLFSRAVAPMYFPPVKQEIRK